MLEFCSVCDNTLGLVLQASEGSASKVQQKCLACGTTHHLTKGCHILFEWLGTAAATEMYRQYLDPSIFEDPAIAKLQTTCPHCATQRTARYVRFGTGIDYLYACETCKTFWTRARGGAPVIVDDQRG